VDVRRLIRIRANGQHVHGIDLQTIVPGFVRLGSSDVKLPSSGPFIAGRIEATPALKRNPRQGIGRLGECRGLIEKGVSLIELTA
ncbi:hypothetical protein ABTP39_19335, partial [Acinetobacter baumannii]